MKLGSWYNPIKKGVVPTKKIESAHLFLLGFAHFFVDFSCTSLLALLAAQESYEEILLYAALYNGLAFAFQLPLGALGDIWQQNRLMAALGCCLVAAGALMQQPLVLCVLIGLGNACFHVGGGREVLLRGGGKAGLAGRFVAPGALGIFLGPKLANSFSWLPLLLFAGLAVFSLLLFSSHRRTQSAAPPSAEAVVLTGPKRVLFLSCMFLTVLIRSYMGTVLRYSFLGSFLPALLFSLCIFGGKFWGGSLADRFGVLRFSTVSQLLSCLFLVLSVWIPYLAMPGIFLFNTSMAITAAGLYRAVPRFPGAMFGLTTFALYLGILPRLLGWQNVLFHGWGLALLGLVSAALLIGGLLLLKGGPAHVQARDVVGSVSGTDLAS